MEARVYLDGALFKMDHHPMEVRKPVMFPTFDANISSCTTKVDVEACTGAGSFLGNRHSGCMNGHLSLMHDALWPLMRLLTFCQDFCQVFFHTWA